MLAIAPAVLRLQMALPHMRPFRLRQGATDAVDPRRSGSTGRFIGAGRICVGNQDM